ncbi:MAG: hypothetical protein PHS82_03080 [Lachnospiraceae bacterium]|nr:hypothetical protein [Lachnospiraceae bacterium]
MAKYIDLSANESVSVSALLCQRNQPVTQNADQTPPEKEEDTNGSNN